MEDWADRVVTLAYRAFKDLPDSWKIQQSVMRFCLGLEDNEAGKYVCLREPGSIESAINLVRQYQHVHQASSATEVSRRSSSDKSRRVYAVQPQAGVELGASPGGGSSEVSELQALVEDMELHMLRLQQSLDSVAEGNN